MHGVVAYPTLYSNRHSVRVQAKNISTPNGFPFSSLLKIGYLVDAFILWYPDDLASFI